MGGGGGGDGNSCDEEEDRYIDRDLGNGRDQGYEFRKHGLEVVGMAGSK